MNISIKTRKIKGVREYVGAELKVYSTIYEEDWLDADERAKLVEELKDCIFQLERIEIK